MFGVASYHWVKSVVKQMFCEICKGVYGTINEPQFAPFREFF
jgi:hypothetical protein